MVKRIFWRYSGWAMRKKNRGYQFLRRSKTSIHEKLAYYESSKKLFWFFFHLLWSSILNYLSCGKIGTFLIYWVIGRRKCSIELFKNNEDHSAMMAHFVLPNIFFCKNQLKNINKCYQKSSKFKKIYRFVLNVLCMFKVVVKS